MKKFLFVFMLIAIISLAGCQMATNKIKDIDGVSMVATKYACGMLGLTYANKPGGFVIKQDDINLEFDFSKNYVYKDGYIMYVMENPAIDENNVAYLPLSFFSDYLKVDMKQGNKLSQLDSQEFSLYNVVEFLPQEIVSAINNDNYPNRDKILKAVEMPRSMGIQIPNINMDKAIDPTPLSEFSNVFKAELSQHGLSEKEIAGLSYSDYRTIERSWKLSEEMIESVKKSYPELADRDLSSWTHGDYQAYYTKHDKENFAKSFTPAQISQLNKRGILLEDLHWLFKESYTIDTILAQPDEVLKKIIEGYYQFAIDNLAGLADEYAVKR